MGASNSIHFRRKSMKEKYGHSIQAEEEKKKNEEERRKKKKKESEEEKKEKVW